MLGVSLFPRKTSYVEKAVADLHIAKFLYTRLPTFLFFLFSYRYSTIVSSFYNPTKKIVSKFAASKTSAALGSSLLRMLVNPPLLPGIFYLHFRFLGM